jgi:ribosomal protein L37AE/L43A
MKLIDVDNAEVEVEDSWQEECPQCGDTNVQCHYIPNWDATRCYDCLVNEAIKFHYRVEEK